MTRRDHREAHYTYKRRPYKPKLFLQSLLHVQGGGYGMLHHQCKTIRMLRFGLNRATGRTLAIPILWIFLFLMYVSAQRYKKWVFHRGKKMTKGGRTLHSFFLKRPPLAHKKYCYALETYLQIHPEFFLKNKKLRFFFIKMITRTYICLVLCYG